MYKYYIYTHMRVCVCLCIDMGWYVPLRTASLEWPPCAKEPSKETGGPYRLRVQGTTGYHISVLLTAPHLGVYLGLICCGT